MKLPALRLFSLVLALGVAGLQASAWGGPADDRALAKSLAERIEHGDYAAFDEATKLDPSMAIGFLWWYAENRSTVPKRADAAERALKNVHGFESDYAKKMADDASNPKLYDILAAIGNEEAVRVVAPYLFDFKIVDEKDPTYVPAFLAAYALKMMKVPDRPYIDPVSDGIEDIVIWQKWVLAQHLVPKEWSSRVGLSPYLKLFRDEVIHGPPPPKLAEPPNRPGSTPTPLLQ